MKKEGCPETLIEAIAYFAKPQVAHDFMVGMRWPNGVRCPMCNGSAVSFYSNRRVFRCAPCKKQFTLKTGTIFEDSPLPLEKWLPCVWLIVNAKNGVSSCEIARGLGVTQKTAWFMLHRVRAALKVGNFDKFSGTVEADETYVGGRGENMHKEVKRRKLNGRGTTGKAVVMGLLRRDENGNTKVRAKLVRTPNKATVHGEIHRNVEPGSNVYTDSMLSYRGLDRSGYVHRAVDHAVEYVNGNVHTNNLENFWALLKRTIRGTYVHVEAAQLEAYLDEQAWRYNERKSNDGERFATVTKALCGKRLTYKQLISRDLSWTP
jgi:transposase-like protein